jgi:hypothetical protein
MAPKVKLLKLSTKKTIIVKSNLKDMSLDTIPKTTEVQHIVLGNMVGDKMTTQNDAEDEHYENERANWASTYDDNNIYVNIPHPYLLYPTLKIHC